MTHKDKHRIAGDNQKYRDNYDEIFPPKKHGQHNRKTGQFWCDKCKEWVNGFVWKEQSEYPDGAPIACPYCMTEL